MDGLTTTLLTVLLSWTRSLASRFWSLVSGNGTENDTFFKIWKPLVLVLCVIGLAIDLTVRIKNNRSKRVNTSAVQNDSDPDVIPEPVQEKGPIILDEALPDCEETSGFAPFLYANVPERTAKAEETRRFETVPRYGRSYAPPIRERVILNTEAFRNSAPIFDEEPVEEWKASTSPVPAVSAGYIRDMTDGYAKPLSPEQIYRPAQPPVHPGLENDWLQIENLHPVSSSPYVSQKRPADFHPFTDYQEPETPYGSSFNRLAKKAMDLVGLEREGEKRGVQDLHSNVDIRQAFHAPVYPKSNPYPDNEE